MYFIKDANGLSTKVVPKFKACRPLNFDVLPVDFDERQNA